MDWDYLVTWTGMNLVTTLMIFIDAGGELQFANSSTGTVGKLLEDGFE
jgi:hypothetical protein